MNTIINLIHITMILKAAKALFFVISLLAIFPFLGSAQSSYKVGTANGTNTAYSYPCPFPDYSDGVRQQYLFKASELIAAGMGPGLIMGISWDIKNKNSQSATIPNYEVSIGTTNATSLSAWATGLTTIYSAASYTTSVGTHTFTLPTPFMWNGTDNVVIQVCEGSTGCYTYSQNASVEYTNLNFAGTRYYQSFCSGSLQCNTTTGYTYNSRPVTSFLWAAPCNGVPSGYSVDGPYQVCPNRPFNLGLNGPVLANLTHKWEYSNDGVNWSTFNGIGGSTERLTDSLTTGRWYRCVILCNNSGRTYTTAPWKVSIAPFYYCYCMNYMASDAGIDIGNVTIVSDQSKDTILNVGDPTPAVNNKTAVNQYTEYNYTAPHPCVYRDSSYIFLVKEINAKATFEGAHLTVFIDYNRDGEFDTSAAAGEKVISKKLDGTNTPAQLVSALVKVPSNADIGYTGMRVILSKDTVGIACGELDGDGEVEDYIIKICYRPCDGPTKAGITLSTDTSMCVGYRYTLTDTSYEQKRSGFTRSWQVSADNINWLNLNNTTDKDTMNRSFTGQPLYYRIRVICPVTDDTTYGQEVFVNAKPGYKCYCYSEATGGIDDDSSDIGGITIGDYSQNDGGAHIKNLKADNSRTDHTDDSPLIFYTDSVYSFNVFHTLNTAEHGDAKITVFVDFNNNHQYDIPDERIYTGFTSVGNHTLVDNLTIPYNVITDVPTGMRFILNNEVGPNVASDEACGDYTSGETEDFIVIFRRGFPASVNGVDAVDNFSIYPNPTTGKFNIRLDLRSSGQTSDIQISVSTITGKQILKVNDAHNGSTYSKVLDLSGYSSGVYFVKVSLNGREMVRKLILE